MRATATVLLFLALPAAAQEPPALAVPRLVVQAPPELAPAAREIEQVEPDALRAGMRLTGLSDPGPPIAVLLAPEGSGAAQSAPPWVTGFADGRAGVVVLLPARVPRYPTRSLEALLQHEVAHVLIHRAAGGRPVPRWFHEGLAMAASRGHDLEDRSRVALAVLLAGRVTFPDLDRAFHGGRSEVQSAYALSGDFVDDLLSRHGTETGAAILAEVSRGARFEDAFSAATGESLDAVAASYWQRRTLWNRWVPAVTSSAALWIAITLLALLAFRRRRARDARLRRLWEEEEAAPEDEELVN